MNSQKQAAVESIVEALQQNEVVIFTDYQGIGAFDAQKMRLRFQEAGVSFKVLKNTLLEIAVKKTGREEALRYLTGPTGVLLEAKGGNTAAKLLVEAEKENLSLKIKGGIYCGELMTEERIHALATCPPREELLAKLCFTLQSPLQTMAAQLKAMPRKLLLTLKAIQEKKEGGSP